MHAHAEAGRLEIIHCGKTAGLECTIVPRRASVVRIRLHENPQADTRKKGETMKLMLNSAILVTLTLSTSAVASENESSQLVALDKATFVLIDKSNEGLQTVKLFKIDGNKLTLADAIQISEHKINYTPSYEVQRSVVQTK
jgi:hypothetical protein